MRTWRTTALRLLAAASLLLLAGACGEADGPADEPDTPTDEATPDDPDEPDTTQEDAIDEALVDHVTAAVEAAAADADVSADDVEVVRAESVTWSDGAVGCPQPGEMYTQALVEGYRIELSVAGETVSYHGADGDEPFRCDDPQEPADGEREVS